MKRKTTTYVCDLCGRNIQGDGVKRYKLHSLDPFSSIFPNHWYDICDDCADKIKKYVKDKTEEVDE